MVERYFSLQPKHLSSYQQVIVIAGKDLFLGMFSNESELVDQVMVSAMKAREEHPLRQSSG